MAFGYTLMQCFLFIFNVIFFICGAAILGVGIWARVDPDFEKYIEIVNLDGEKASFEHATYLLIAVGAFIFLVGFLGCCGACNSSSCMLGLYAAFLILVVVLEIAAASLAIAFNEKLEDELREKMQKQVEDKVSNDTTDALTLAWFATQVEFKCCGANGYKDYSKSNTWGKIDQPVPPTCCVLTNSDAEKPVAKDLSKCYEAANRKTTPTSEFLHTKGCYQSLVDWIESHATILIGIGFGVAAFEVIGIVFACCLMSDIRSGKV